jgi:peptidoglycan/xylan/chitin deacetylase (PgdA/CDA1 family)
VRVKPYLKRAAENIVATLAPSVWSAGRSTRLLVLMYHRSLPPGHPDRKTEQPGMFVSPETLDLHLATLRQYFELVHLDDWLRRAEAGEPLPRLACALTFDDGWRDNYEYAFPVLVRHRAPATIFLVSGLIGTESEFWPNRLARLLASAGKRPLAGKLGEVLATARARPQDAQEWTSGDIDRAIGLMKQLGEAECHELIGAEEKRHERGGQPRALLNEEEIRTMAASGLVRFGSHTQTHFRCREGAPADTLRREIVDSRAQIAAAAGAPADLFCYPNGDTTQAARDLVSQNYLGAVTTVSGWHSPRADRFLIKRTGLHEDVSSRRAALLARISGWL